MLASSPPESLTSTVVTRPLYETSSIVTTFCVRFVVTMQSAESRFSGLTPPTVMPKNAAMRAMRLAFVTTL